MSYVGELQRRRRASSCPPCWGLCLMVLIIWCMCTRSQPILISCPTLRIFPLHRKHTGGVHRAIRTSQFGPSSLSFDQVQAGQGVRDGDQHLGGVFSDNRAFWPAMSSDTKKKKTLAQLRAEKEDREHEIAVGCQLAIDTSARSCRPSRTLDATMI